MRTPDPRSADYPPPGHPPRRPADGEMFDLRIPGRSLTTVALTCAAITVVFPPAVIAALGFAFGGQRRGDPWGQRVILTSLIALGLGIVLSVVAANVDPDTFAVLRLGNLP